MKRLSLPLFAAALGLLHFSAGTTQAAMYNYDWSTLSG